MLRKALQHKYPNWKQITIKRTIDGVVTFLAWEVPDVPEPPPESEWDAIIKIYTDYLKTIEYKEKRAVAYDPIPEQLDQIYHDMDGWKKRIKSVKDKYPKPSE